MKRVTMILAITLIILLISTSCFADFSTNDFTAKTLEGIDASVSDWSQSTTLRSLFALVILADFTNNNPSYSTDDIYLIDGIYFAKVLGGLGIHCFYHLKNDSLLLLSYTPITKSAQYVLYDLYVPRDFFKNNIRSVIRETDSNATIYYLSASDLLEAAQQLSN